MRNSVTKILIHHLSTHPDVTQLPYTTKDLVNKLVLDHSNHLLILALAAAALEDADWNILEEAVGSIKEKD